MGKFKRVIPAVLVSVSWLAFQNCSPQKFSSSNSSLLSSLGVPGGQGSQIVITKMNVAKQFTAVLPAAASGVSRLSLASGGSPSSSVATAHGSVQILDPNQLTLLFTPSFGFRGEDRGLVYAFDKDGNSVSTVIQFLVGNGLDVLKPALAVRATGCVMCHSNVDANVVTDFGFGGDGAGHDYFFAKDLAAGGWNASGSPAFYGDRDATAADGTGSWGTVNLSSTSTVFVPSVAIPAGAGSPGALFGVSNLADYLRNRLASAYRVLVAADLKNGTTPPSGPAAVREISSVYIGAPTAARLRAAFNASGAAGQQLYYPDGASAYPLSGLSLPLNAYFTNSGRLACEGDLFLDGPLLLSDLKLATRTGCRIYATGSVTITGPVTYLNSDASASLQIVSSRAILLGLGGTMINGSVCEQSGWYREGVLTVNKGRAPGMYASSLLARLSVAGAVMLRSGDSPAAVNGQIASENALLPPQLDASCQPGGRAVSYARLLLNAPIVHSRYTGAFDGTIIAEYALMGLGGRFTFSFDPVFSSVPVLPFLSDGDYLTAQ